MLLQNGNGGQVERVACVAPIEGHYAAFTKNDVRIVLAEHVLGGKKELVYRCRGPALEKNWLSAFAGLDQERKVLHGTRPNLENIHIIGDERHHIAAHNLAHRRYALFFPNSLNDLQAFLCKPLEGVRRGARLKRAAP